MFISKVPSVRCSLSLVNVLRFTREEVEVVVKTHSRVISQQISRFNSCLHHTSIIVFTAALMSAAVVEGSTVLELFGSNYLG